MVVQGLLSAVRSALLEVYNQETGTKGKGEEKMVSLGGYRDPLADLFGALFYLKANSIVKLRSKVDVVEPLRAGGPPRAVLELSVLLTKKGITFDGPFDTADMQYESARVKCAPQLLHRDTLWLKGRRPGRQLGPAVLLLSDHVIAAVE